MSSSKNVWCSMFAVMVVGMLVASVSNAKEFAFSNEDIDVVQSIGEGGVSVENTTKEDEFGAFASTGLFTGVYNTRPDGTQTCFPPAFDCIYKVKRAGEPGYNPANTLGTYTTFPDGSWECEAPALDCYGTITRYLPRRRD